MERAIRIESKSDRRQSRLYTSRSSFTDACTMISFIIFFACSDVSKESSSNASGVSPKEPSMSSTQQNHHIPLPFHKPQPVPDLGGTVTLVSGSRDTVKGEDGKTRHEATVGTLEFTLNGKKSKIAFTSGQTFSYADRNMAVYGVMSLELVIAPVGEYPSP